MVVFIEPLAGGSCKAAFGLPFRILYRSRLGIFRQSWEIRVGRVGAEPLVGWEVRTFQHGQNPPPCGVGDAFRDPATLCRLNCSAKDRTSVLEVGRRIPNRSGHPRSHTHNITQRQIRIRIIQDQCTTVQKSRPLPSSMRPRRTSRALPQTRTSSGSCQVNKL